MKKPSKPSKSNSAKPNTPETSGKPQPLPSKPSSKPRAGARTPKVKKPSTPLRPCYARRVKIEEWCEIVAPDEPILLANGHDHAFIGIAFINHRAIALYDQHRTIEGIRKEIGGDHAGAQEYFDFNVAGAYVGEHTPAFMVPFSEQLDWIELDMLITFITEHEQAFVQSIIDCGVEKRHARSTFHGIVHILADQAINQL